MTDISDTPQWRSMDAQSRAIAYSPSSALDGPIDPLIKAYVENSKAAYSACRDVTCISYGDRRSNTIDFVAPDSQGPLPLHIFLHGGYWQELSKKESFFAAPDTLARGMAFAAVDYTLAPEANIDAIIAECCAAILRLIRDAKQLNIDPVRIVLTGSSAGAHLAAMCCLKLPADQRPAGLVLMSGIYELEPLVGTYVNDALAMDIEAARRNSPALADVSGFPPAVIAWGGHETDEFKRQSQLFARLLADAGRQVETLEMAQRNHFDIVEDIANTSALGQKMAGLVDQMDGR